VNILINFFAVRPVFTSLGLRLVWFAFLVQQAITLASVLLNNADYFKREAWYALLTFLFHIFINLVLIRVLIEVAARVLLQTSPNKAAEHSN
jgi:hypothetical protein